MSKINLRHLKDKSPKIERSCKIKATEAYSLDLHNRIAYLKIKIRRTR
jgi:hypothetical protein